jgi:archaeal type IV pilus assembly protein PilA
MIKFKTKIKEDGISPVVGVMLMLVVTIIIAAVVSAFAGGITTTTGKPPTMAMDVTIKNTGYASTSYILFTIQSVSEAISTRDLRIVTSWASADGQHGGNTTMSNMTNTVFGSNKYNSPLGFGSGVTSEGAYQQGSGSYDPGQWFGNYSLRTGTIMRNSPGYSGTWGSGTCSGYGCNGATLSPYVYSSSADYTDGMQAVLGENWNATRPGDVVTVRILHIPTGKMIFDKQVVVVG